MWDGWYRGLKACPPPRPSPRHLDQDSSSEDCHRTSPSAAPCAVDCRSVRPKNTRRPRLARGSPRSLASPDAGQPCRFETYLSVSRHVTNTSFFGTDSMDSRQCVRHGAMFLLTRQQQGWRWLVLAMPSKTVQTPCLKKKKCWRFFNFASRKCRSRVHLSRCLLPRFGFFSNELNSCGQVGAVGEKAIHLARACVKPEPRLCVCQLFVRETKKCAYVCAKKCAYAHVKKCALRSKRFFKSAPQPSKTPKPSKPTTLKP